MSIQTLTEGGSEGLTNLENFLPIIAQNIYLYMRCEVYLTDTSCDSSHRREHCFLGLETMYSVLLRTASSYPFSIALVN